MTDSRVTLNGLKQQRRSLRDYTVSYTCETQGPDHARQWRAMCTLGPYSTPFSGWYTNQDDAKMAAAAVMVAFILANNFV